jgi:hypothetical protein
MKSLWAATLPDEWHATLQTYESVIARQDSQRLPALDRWYREDLADAVVGRKPAHVTLDELVKITEWKMARGVWRARNLALVRSNAPADIEEVSAAALMAIPNPTTPITLLAKLAGVGPATASAVVAATNPEFYPFFDELVAAQIPQAGKLVFNLKYYAWYAEALRERATRLGHGWTPAMVERALWANCGGKAGAV